ncbi:MAG: homocysteine S-methyltransferase family protein [candidate division Zixibacteria bacterium]
MEPILERLKCGEIIVADGAMGTILQRHGIDINQCVESVNLENPRLLEHIASEYLKAGSEIIQTNTFGASPAKLENYNLQDKTESIIESAIKSVRNVVGNSAHVSGSCGPTGKLLKPYGDTEPEILYQSFQRQMRSFINSGVDIICVETMIDISEAILAVKAAREISSSVPIMATMTFEKTPRGFYTIMGVDINRACTQLKEAGADIVGSNCGNGLDLMIDIAKEFKSQSDMPILIQSNAGLPVIQNGQPVYNEPPEYFEHKIPHLIKLGISIIGGCCGTTPEHIAVIRKLVDQHK